MNGECVFFNMLIMTLHTMTANGFPLEHSLLALKHNFVCEDFYDKEVVLLGRTWGALRIGVWLNIAF